MIKSNSLQNWIKVKIKDDLILTIKNISDYKYWKLVYPDAAIILK